MGAAGSVNKVFWSELDIALHETALDLLGAEAELGVALARRLHVLAVRPDLRRHQRDPAQHRRRADPRPPARAARGARMRFELTDDQRDFAASLEPAAGRGRHRRGGPGLGRRRPRARAQALGAPGRAGRDDAGHRGDARSRSCVAFEALGRHAVPGPVGRVGGLPARSRCGRERRGDRHASRCRRTCRTRSTPTSPTRSTSSRRRLADATVGRCTRSVDRTRRLFEVTPASGRRPNRERVRPGRARHLGPAARRGERLLADSVTYVKQRRQFGREIGSYQAIKHALADVRIALDFARPLVYGARARRDLARVGGEGRVRRRGVPRLPHRPPGARRDRLHRRVRPQHLDHQGPRAASTPGARRRSTAAPAARQELGVPDGVRVQRGAAGARVDVRSLLAKRADSARRARRRRVRDRLRRVAVADCSASRSASPRSPSRRSTTAPGSRCFESMVALEELGRSLAPSPLLASLVTAEALLAGGDEDAKQRLLPRIAAGEVAAVALGRRPGARSATRPPSCSPSATTTCSSSTPASSDQNWLPSMDQTSRFGSLDATGGTRIGDGAAARARAAAGRRGRRRRAPGRAGGPGAWR